MLSGAVAGDKVLIRVNNGSAWHYIAGELLTESSDSVSPIDISSKTDLGQRRLMDGEGLRTVQLSLNLIFNNSLGFNYLRTAFLAGDSVPLEIVKEGAEDVLVISYFITSWSADAADNAAYLAAVTLVSTGELVPPDFAIGDFYWPLSDASGDVEGTFSVDRTFTVVADGVITIANYQMPSLRADGGGSALQLTSDVAGNNAAVAENYIQVVADAPSSDFNIAWSNGFTIEFINKVDRIDVDIINSRGKVGAGIFCNVLSGAEAKIFNLQYDNYNGVFSDPLNPTLTLHDRAGSPITTYATYGTQLEDEIRSSDTLTLGEIRHFLATFRPSNDTVEFFLDGVSQGEITVPTSWWTAGGDDLLTGASATQMRIGSAQLQGTGSNMTMQDLRIHLLEADQAFATQQFEAALVNT